MPQIDWWWIALTVFLGGNLMFLIWYWCVLWQVRKDTHADD